MGHTGQKAVGEEINGEVKRTFLVICFYICAELNKLHRSLFTSFPSVGMFGAEKHVFSAQISHRS